MAGCYANGGASAEDIRGSCIPSTPDCCTCPLAICAALGDIQGISVRQSGPHTSCFQVVSEVLNQKCGKLPLPWFCCRGALPLLNVFSTIRTGCWSKQFTLGLSMWYVLSACVLLLAGEQDVVPGTTQAGLYNCPLQFCKIASCCWKDLNDGDTNPLSAADWRRWAGREPLEASFLKP